MVDDIASDSESTSTTNDSKASDKCESPLIVSGSTDTKIREEFCQKLLQKFEEKMTRGFQEFDS